MCGTRSYFGAFKKKRIQGAFAVPPYRPTRVVEVDAGVHRVIPTESHGGKIFKTWGMDVVLRRCACVYCVCLFVGWFVLSVRGGR